VFDLKLASCDRGQGSDLGTIWPPASQCDPSMTILPSPGRPPITIGAAT